MRESTDFSPLNPILAGSVQVASRASWGDGVDRLEVDGRHRVTDVSLPIDGSVE